MESKEADYQRRQTVKRKRSEEASRQEIAKETREKLNIEADGDCMKEEEDSKRLKEIERERHIVEMEEI